MKLSWTFSALVLMAGAINIHADQTVTVNPGFNFLACQVVNGNNNINLILPSLPADADDSNLFPWDFSLYQYSADPQNWVEGFGWNDGTYLWADGQGAILQWAGASEPITFVGGPATGSKFTLPPAGDYILVGSPLPDPHGNGLVGWNDIISSPVDTYPAFTSALVGWAVYQYNGNFSPAPGNGPLGFTVYYYGTSGWVPSPPSIPSQQAVFVGPSPAVIEGFVYNGAGTVGLENWVVQAGPGSQYGITDSTGHYIILAAPGNYTITPVSQPGWTQTGTPASYSVTAVNGGDYTGNDFHETYNGSSGVPYDLQVDLTSFSTSPLTSPCCGENLTYFISYRNNGVSTIAGGATITLNYPQGIPDSGLPTVTYVSDTSTPNVSPAVSGPNTLMWTIPATDLGPGASGTISVVVNVNTRNCIPTEVSLNANDAGFGATATAMVDPATGTITSISCSPGSGYTVSPTVVINGAGTGANATANVAGGQVTSITVNNGGINYLSSSSSPLTAVVTANPTPGNSLGTLATDLAPPALVLVPNCSVDPNDMQVTPQGCGPQGLIPAGQELTYLIEFQNTGTAPAYQVVVSNTLPAGLDPSTVVLVGSSHPNAFKIQGHELIWTFPSIRLPAKSVNEPASHGYVKYRIKPLASDTVGTVITNGAAVYFDLNAPVITVLTTNTITSSVVPVAAFTVSPHVGTAGHTVDFTYTGGTAGAQFLWNFGPNATPTSSTDENPSGVVFSTTGRQVVSLVTSAGGCDSQMAVDVLQVGAPVLKVNLEGGQLTFSWQGDGFHLQEKSNLSPATPWTASAATVTQAGSSYWATAPISGGMKFYRLSQVAP